MDVPTLVLLVFLAAVVSGWESGCPTSDAPSDCTWARFKADFGKSYATGAEEALRRAAFEARLAEVARLNAEMPSARFSINKFSDLSREEFSGRFLSGLSPSRPGAPSAAREPRSTARARAGGLPAEYHSPYDTAVKDQGLLCGGCWAVASAGLCETSWKRATNRTVVFSAQQLIDCDSRSYGCSGGYPETALDLIVKSSADGGGLMSEAEYPYESANGQCRYDANLGFGKFAEWHTVPWGTDEQAMMTEIVDRGPLLVTLDANTSHSYSSGVLPDSQWCHNRTNHAVLLVGWGHDSKTGMDFWLLRNSWGVWWGDYGYFRLERGKRACLVTADPAIGITADPKHHSGSSCTPNMTCDDVFCGTWDNGCGRLIICESCTSTEVCTETGMCSSDGKSPADWEQFLPAKAKKDFKVTGYGASLVVATSTKQSYDRRIRWVPSDALASQSWSSFMVSASAASGAIGVGLKLGQGTGANDGVLFKYALASSASANKADLSLCIRKKGSEKCSVVAKAVAWNKKGVNNVTVVSYLSTDGKKYALVPSLNGAPSCGNKVFTVPVTDYLGTGRYFLMAYGSAVKKWSNFRLATKTRVYAKVRGTAPCITVLEWKLRVAKLLNVDPITVDDVVGSDPSGLCGSSKRQSVPAFSEFDFVLQDAETTGAMGGSPARAQVSSSSLFARLQANSKAFSSLAGSELVSVSAVPPDGLPGALMVAAAGLVASAALSAWAIAGIAAGCAAVGLAVAGVASVGIYKIAHRNSASSSGDVIITREAARRSLNPKRASLGADLIALNPRFHESITARSPRSSVQLSSPTH